MTEGIAPIKVSLRRRRLKNGNYSYFLDYYEILNGLKYRRRLSVGRDKKKAEVLRSKIEWKLFQGESTSIPGQVSATHIDTFFKRFLDHSQKTRSAESVKKDHGRHMTILEFFKQRNLKSIDQITPGMVQQLQGEYLGNHSKKGWNCLLGIMKVMLNRAVEWGLIEFNPIAKVKSLKIESKLKFFEEREMKRILKAAEGPMHDAILILVSTGIRRSELWNLRWRDVDFKTKKIIIRPHGEFSTKSKRIRSIPMTENLYGRLREMKKSAATEYVWRHYKNIGSIRKAFLRILKRLGIEGTIHDLRHTFASHLAMNCVTIPVIKELLGHSDIRTTMIYSHLSPGIHRSEIRKLPF